MDPRSDAREVGAGVGWATPVEGYPLLGVRVSTIDLESATGSILDAVGRREKGYVCVTGAHGVIESLSSPELRTILNAAFLVTPDGMPTVWMGKLSGFLNMDRVYGPDLMERVCERTRTLPVRHFLFGGQEGVADQLRAALEARFPGIQIVGTYCPPFRPLTSEEEEDLQRRVREADPDLFWVGLSTPKQERFMSAYLPKLDTRIMLGVGAAFDFHTGRVRQAPRWIQRSGLEWFFRLLHEPRRLWRRYALVVPKFIALATLERLGIIRFPLPPHSRRGPGLPWEGGMLQGFPLLLLLGGLSAVAVLALRPGQFPGFAAWALVLLGGNFLNLLITMAASDGEDPSGSPGVRWPAVCARVGFLTALVALPAVAGAMVFHSASAARWIQSMALGPAVLPVLLLLVFATVMAWVPRAKPES